MTTTIEQAAAQSIQDARTAVTQLGTGTSPERTTATVLLSLTEAVWACAVQLDAEAQFEPDDDAEPVGLGEIPTGSQVLGFPEGS